MLRRAITRARAVYWAGLAAARGGGCTPIQAAPARRATRRRRHLPGFSHIKSLGGIDEYRLDSNGLDRAAGARSLRAGRDVRGDLSGRIAQRGDRHHRRDAHSRAPDVQGQRNLQRSERQQRQAVAGARRRTIQRQHLLRPHQLLRHHRAREPRGLHRDRSGSHAPSLAARGRSAGRNDGGAQRIRARQEQSGERADGGGDARPPTWRCRITIRPSAGRATSSTCPIAKLRDFYDTFYWPNNATVTVVGDIDTAAVLGLVKKYYGVYPHSPRRFRPSTPRSRAQSGPAARDRQTPGRTGHRGRSRTRCRTAAMRISRRSRCSMPS